MRYHARRRAHYEGLHRFHMFAVILLGSAAFGDLAGESTWLGLSAAVFGALDLTFGWPSKATTHHMLYGRFADLAIAIRTAGDPTQEKIAEWRKRRIEIEMDEQPIFWAVEKSCHNEVLRAWGRVEDDASTLSWWERRFMNWRRFEKIF